MSTMDEVMKELEKIRKEMATTPYYRERTRLREEFKRKKKEERSMRRLFQGKGDVCAECLINMTCTKSFMDKTACEPFTKKFHEVYDAYKKRLRNE